MTRGRAESTDRNFFMANLSGGKRVVVLGASTKPDRYAFKAMELLREYGHQAVPVNPACAEVLGEKCYPSVAKVPEPIDTITIYLRQSRSDPLIEEILEAKPERIIMNPGAENDDLARSAREHGIEVVEGCTLVMLRSGTF
jgi:predicted CoA-binding protein